MLPYGIEALRGFGEVILQEKGEGAGEGFGDGSCLLPDNRQETAGRTYYGDRTGSARAANRWRGCGDPEFSVFFRENSQIIPQKTCTKWLDYDRIESLVLRTRQPGDYLCHQRQASEETSEKDYLIQEKIPVKK